MISKSVPAQAQTRTFAVAVEYVTEHSHERTLVTAGNRGFDDRVDYAAEPGKAAWVHLRGVESVETAAAEMELVAARSSRCQDPVYHLIIAYAKHEHPTRAQVVSDAEKLLSALKMEDHQYVLSAHQDTDDFHAHLIVNRVGPDGRAGDLWKERVIRERVSAEIAAERGWEIVLGHHNRDIVQRIERLHELPPDPERRLSDGAYRRLHERGELPWKDRARSYVLDAVDCAESWSDLHRRLDAHGVVVKLVERGGRVQGLAFAEGQDASAPGCAASRVDARCALSALERCFGPYVPAHELGHAKIPEGVPPPTYPGNKSETSQRWSDNVRAAILAEVDTALSWDELREGLARHGIVVKLVQRGDRIQGLAFAEGESIDAPGCGASKIDPRCRKSVLEERFGPFPPEARRPDLGEKQEAEHTRRAVDSGEERTQHTPHPFGERASQPEERKAERPGYRAGHGHRQAGERAVHEAQRVVDHAKMRSTYKEYRERLFEERLRANGDRYEKAWAAEKARRKSESNQRSRDRQWMRAAVRIGSRGPLRQVAYWAVDATTNWRRDRDFGAARVRWEAAKIVLRADRNLGKEDRPMDYRSFVAEQARRGDHTARQVYEDLTRPSRGPRSAEIRREVRRDGLPPENQPHKEAQVEKSCGTDERAATLGEVRSRLASIREEKTANCERARAERRALSRIEKPPSVDSVLDACRTEVENETALAAGFTGTEQAALKRLAEERRSWNPFTRADAKRTEELLRASQQQRYNRALRASLMEFEENEAPQQLERLAAEEQRYRQYVERSCDLEIEMNRARNVAEDIVPKLEEKLQVIEEAGIFEIGGAGKGSGAAELAIAIERCYRGIPQATRGRVEEKIRRAREVLDRSRDLLSSDNL